ncbi:beta-1,4-N-acetylgalactosaminyltransferase 3 [Melanotaenia boesemani]|uniref:beta-1,4-N-acetylgalactosaminyltransferase 3 n=1 Tax=Melanotaenia boesemani TaxID=1250792 RepID=UPI001C03CF90|nr:beta-1,4-N-acetylgalactosaminyltransferase 3 [Melanotaenia boesemani]
MIAAFFPFKKLRRNVRYFLFGAILLVGVFALYHEMVAAKMWSSNISMNPDTDVVQWRRVMLDQRDDQPVSVEDSAAWISSYTPQTWKPEFKGQANLHVFEDWCGSSTADLRKNLHYPLYPHSRSTVQKLAVSPQWINYGLRIFGYLHPYTNGDFVFALSSDDNSELWLSTDDSPVNLQLLAWVGKTGTEWTAPGEFEKYASQTSKPIRLSAQRRYFFEVIHKQNDRGTDHVEVAWKFLGQGLRFTVIESKHISLYANESALLMNDVAHIPQTAASHQHAPTKQRSVAADMLRDDPRDALYKVRLINSKFLQGVLPDCSYKPSYTIKDFPLERYQGLQFVHMSYIYPNDYTRLTHMETENSCFYPESPYKMKIFGFSRYMRLDRPDAQDRGNAGRDFNFQKKKSFLDEEDGIDNKANEREKKVRFNQMNNALFPDYGDDYDDYVQKRRRKLFSLVTQETNRTLDKSTDERLHTQEFQIRQSKETLPQPHPEPIKRAESVQLMPMQASKHLEQNGTQLKQEGSVKRMKSSVKLRPKKRQKVNLSKRSEQMNPPIQVDKEQLRAKQQPTVPSKQLDSKLDQIQRTHKVNHTQIQSIKDSQLKNPDTDVRLPKKNMVGNQWKFVTKEKELANTKHFTSPRKDANRLMVRSSQVEPQRRKRRREKEIEMNVPLQDDAESHKHRVRMTDQEKIIKTRADTKGDEDEAWNKDDVNNRGEGNRDAWEGDEDSPWGQPGDFVDDEDLTTAPVFDIKVSWNQTFQVNHLDLQAHRSDWIDLNCNVSGNLLLDPSDALPMVKAFMERLNAKHRGRFTLERVVNVVKRVDRVQGNRYLLELELRDANGQLLRLTHYIYALIRHSRQRSEDYGFLRQKPQLVLCNPVGFRWNPFATVHFIVPVKNQARWVQQLIVDMEQLFRKTGDANFNVIITDFDSTDMDVRKALQKSSLPRYQYVKLSGNFERSAGLQAGINLINDDHSIVFLCDLHIHFPSSIIDMIRKHCVEGYMAFAPIVLRLNCGAIPLEAKGFWEVNGFGLLGIYKSDLDAIGGMNTREFRDRWGGEDWELLDRILQSGLEVERIYLKNFFHHYHSKRGMWNRQMSTSHR